MATEKLDFSSVELQESEQQALADQALGRRESSSNDSGVSGRIDVKIPLFPTLEPREGFMLLRALCKRVGPAIPEEAYAGLEATIPEMLTPGAAEAIAVKTYRLAGAM